MYSEQELCSVCLQHNSELKCAKECDANNVKWSCKLRFCVPEVEWTNDYYVCASCRAQLNVFCDFRNRCLEFNGFCNQVIYGKVDTKAELTDAPSCHCVYCASTVTINSRPKIDYTCYLCNETFSVKLNLIKHITSHSAKCCEICNHSFTTQTQLQLHVTQTHKKATDENVRETLQTSNCSREEIYVENSSKFHNNTLCDPKLIDKELIKDYCDDSNDADSNQDKHEESTFEEKTLKCITKGQKRMRKTDFICEDCKSVFISSKKLINHAFRVHGYDPSAIKPFKCDKCNAKFSKSSHLTQHKKYHVGSRPHICTFCGKGYITKSDLNTHEKQHLNKREYQCPSCPKTFNTNKDLRSHRLVVHTDSSLWNYVCTFCQKRFPIKSNLDQHMRRHTGEKRFGCHICEKRFVDKIVLQKHIKSHSNFRAFKCQHCAKEYKDERILDIHMTKIHGIGNAKIPVRVKKYFCHVCPESYFAKNKLTRHMFSHTGEKPYSCHVCERRFTDKSYLKRHLKSTHNILEIHEDKYFFKSISD